MDENYYVLNVKVWSDVQYDMNGQHLNVEFDTKSNNGLKHQQTIQTNDPNSKKIFKTVE